MPRHLHTILVYTIDISIRLLIDSIIDTNQSSHRLLYCIIIEVFIAYQLNNF
jgi:hypothetical protein